MLALIDGDIVAYKMSAAVDTPLERVSEGLYRFDETEAVDNAKAFIDDILEAVGATEGKICFTSKENFRKDVLPEYKGNRVNRKPIVYHAVRSALIEWGRVEWFHINGIEADDMLGLLQTETEEETVICSIDKDFLSVPGTVFNWDHQHSPFGATFTEVTQEEADANFLKQAIMGDRTDGYPGAKGYGPKKTEALIEEWGTDEPWKLLLHAYKGDAEEALANARCARILRAGDFNHETGEPILWTPEEL